MTSTHTDNNNHQSTRRECLHSLLMVNEYKLKYKAPQSVKPSLELIKVKNNRSAVLFHYFPIHQCVFKPLRVYLSSIQNKSMSQSKHQLWWKIPPLKAFMEIHRMASIKSISAHMHSPRGGIRNIWTEFPHIHQACWNTMDFKSCFRTADLTWGSLLPLCWHKFTWTIEPGGDQMWSLSNHSLSC